MMSPTPVRFLLSLALVGLIAARTVSRPPVHAQAPAAGATEFVAHEISTGLRGGYQVVIADLNKDGKPDIIAVAQGLPELLWFENPGWQRHVLAGEQAQLINVSAYDIDGDGIPELAVEQGFTTSTKTSKGIISILTHGADVTQPWTVKEIDRVPTAHRLRWIDADGSGRKMLVMAPLIGMDSTAPDYRTPVPIYFYRAPDWKRELLTDSFTGLIHGIEPMPWEGSKGQVLLSAGFMGIYLHRFADGKWTPTEMSKGDPDPWPKSGASDIALGRLGAQKFVATIEPWHGNQIAIYKPNGSAWPRQMIDDTITDGHTIVTIDLDGDGRDEVIVGQRGGARSLILYSASADGASWTRRVIDEGGMAGAGCAAADLNGDKRVDIACIGTATANLKWYENVGKK
jgi:aldos-2-ulose dehydratase/isomerase family protein/VCBS repeat protein